MEHTSRSEGERSDEENMGEVSSINEAYATYPPKPKTTLFLHTITSAYLHACTLARLHICTTPIRRFPLIPLFLQTYCVCIVNRHIGRLNPLLENP